MRHARILALAVTGMFTAPAFAGGGTAPARLMISEFVVTPTAGEMVEIYNPNSFTVDLTDVYLTDATFAGGSVYYYQIVNGGGGGGTFADWFARFPAGATIGAGEFQTISLNGSIGFFQTYNVNPTYEIEEDDGSPDAIPDMLQATPGSIAPGGPGNNGLTNNGEVVILFYWDGQSDLVTDLDYVVYGDLVEAVDKSGVSIDGPDADATASTYANDTPITSQVDASGIMGMPHASGNSKQRLLLSEGIEVRSGGNGLTGGPNAGNDESSENTDQTFIDDVPTPNVKTPGSITIRMTPGTIGANTFEMTGATPFSVVLYLASLGEGFVPAPCIGEGVGAVGPGLLVFTAPTDANGDLTVPVTVPGAGGFSLVVQAYDLVLCRASNMTQIDL